MHARMTAVLTAIALVGFAIGCAPSRLTPAQRAERMDSLLAAAGFRPLAADTPEKVAHLAQLPPLELRKVVKDGVEQYWFADPYLCKCMYVGDAQARRDLKNLLADDAISGDTIRSEEYTGMMADDLSPENEMDPLTDPFGPFAF